MELFLRNTPSVVNIANIGRLIQRPSHCPVGVCTQWKPCAFPPWVLAFSWSEKSLCTRV